MATAKAGHMNKLTTLPIAHTARVLGVSRSRFYYQAKLPVKDDALKKQVASVLHDHPGYGYRRITLELRRRGQRINEKRVLRVMKKYDLWPPVWLSGKPKRPRTKRKNPPSNIPNLAERVCPIQPDVVWAGDFTYIRYQRRWLYLATVIDVYTREIAGWQIGYHHTSRLVIEAIESALAHRIRAPDIFHSDQGSEYTSHDCLERLVKSHVQPSHSPKGKPWKNGRQESFYNTFKKELGDISRFRRFDYFYEAVAQLINYYNQRRIHSALKMPPTEFYEKMKRS